MRRLVLLVPAGAAAGLALGLLVSAVTDRVYAASGLLHVTVTSDVRQVDPEERRLPAEVLARTYAEWLDDRAFLEKIRARVARGALDSDELEERVRARARENTALVELTGEGPSPAAARSLAAEVAGSFVAEVQQTARQRSARVEEDLRRRADELTAAIADVLAGGRGGGGPTAARLEALRAERGAVDAELARAVTRGADAENAVTLAAAPVADPDPIAPRRSANALGGVLLGLVAGLAVALLRRRDVPDAVAPRAAEPPAPRAPQPTLVAPEPEAALAGIVATEARDAERVEYSADGDSWTPVPASEWDTTALPDGRYLLRAAADGVASVGVPVYVDNTPPSVTLAEPAPGDAVRGEVVVRAEAADAGSVVERVEYMVSAGAPEWTTVATGAPPTFEARWRPDGPAGAYWLCAVATDRAGNRAATEPIPLVVGG